MGVPAGLSRIWKDHWSQPGESTQGVQNTKVKGRRPQASPALCKLQAGQLSGIWKQVKPSNLLEKKKKETLSSGKFWSGRTQDCEVLLHTHHPHILQFPLWLSADLRYPSRQLLGSLCTLLPNLCS